jgi:hypothetical protein
MRLAEREELRDGSGFIFQFAVPIVGRINNERIQR